MKIEIGKEFPQYFKPSYPEEFELFHHFEVTAGIPTVLFAVTTWKENGKPNVCFHSWSCFHGDKPDFLLYLSKKEMQKKLQKKYPLHNLLNTYILMMAGRCIELYLENGNLTADEIRILADFRENTIFSHMEDMYRNSRNRIYERIFKVSGGISIYCGLILDIAAGIEEDCGDFMEKGRYEDQWKAGLIRRYVSMEFLLPVNPEVWDTLTRRICKLLKVPYQKNRTEAK